jgi:NADPH2:quinone reductase
VAGSGSRACWSPGRSAPGRSPPPAPRGSSIGAGAAVDYSTPGWSEQVRALTSDGKGVAVVFENISSPELFGEALSTLRPYGRLVTCGSHGGATVPVSMRALYRSHLSIIGETAASAGMTREVWRAVAERRLPPPPVFHRFPLAEAAAAHEAARGRDIFGRVVLTVRDDDPLEEASCPPTGLAGHLPREGGS